MLFPFPTCSSGGFETIHQLAKVFYDTVIEPVDLRLSLQLQLAITTNWAKKPGGERA